jgi:K+-transporting ATPase A subunit
MEVSNQILGIFTLATFITVLMIGRKLERLEEKLDDLAERNDTPEID